METESVPLGRGRRTPPRRSGAVDRVSVLLFSLAAVLMVVAVLAHQLPVAASRPTRILVLRRIYRTTVVETRAGPVTAGPQVTQSVSSSAASVAAPVSRTS